MKAPIRTPVPCSAIRPIYMFTAELPHTVTATVCLSRLDTCVSIIVHPGSPTPAVAADIAARLFNAEGPAWLDPFGHRGPINLAAIQNDPVAELGTIARIPAFDKNIPNPLRPPWLN